MLDFTTATRDQLKQAYNAIARDTNDDRFFTTKELDVLPKILSPREQVLAFSSGAMSGNTWLIVLTDQRVLFVDKGIIFGLKQSSIEVANIVNIQGETGFMFGTIRIADASGVHQIENVWKKSVNVFVNKVREALEARQRGIQLYSPGTDGAGSPDSAQPTDPAPSAPNESPATPSQAADVAGQLERLSRLHNSGALSVAEYESAKSRLLG